MSRYQNVPNSSENLVSNSRNFPGLPTYAFAHAKSIFKIMTLELTGDMGIILNDFLRVSQRIFKSDVFRSLFIAKIEIFTRNCYHSATSPLPNFLKNTVILKIPYFYRSVVWSKSYP